MQVQNAFWKEGLSEEKLISFFQFKELFLEYLILNLQNLTVAINFHFTGLFCEL